MVQGDHQRRRAQLLDRFLAGAIDQSTYDRMLSEIADLEQLSTVTSVDSAAHDADTAKTVFGTISNTSGTERNSASAAVGIPADARSDHTAVATRTGDGRGLAWYNVAAGSLFIQLYVGCAIGVWLVLFLAEVCESAFGYSAFDNIGIIVPLVLIFGLVSLIIGLTQFCSAPKTTNVTSCAGFALALSVGALIVAIVGWLLMLERWRDTLFYLVALIETTWFVANAILCSLFFQGIARSLDNRSLRRNARNWMWFSVVTTAAGGAAVLFVWIAATSVLVVWTVVIIQASLVTISLIWLYSIAGSVRRAIWRFARVHGKP